MNKATLVRLEVDKTDEGRYAEQLLTKIVSKHGLVVTKKKAGLVIVVPTFAVFRSGETVPGHELCCSGCGKPLVKGAMYSVSLVTKATAHYPECPIVPASAAGWPRVEWGCKKSQDVGP